jgi:hypothetical protein
MDATRAVMDGLRERAEEAEAEVVRCHRIIRDLGGDPDNHGGMKRCKCGNHYQGDGAACVRWVKCGYVEIANGGLTCTRHRRGPRGGDGDEGEIGMSRRGIKPRDIRQLPKHIQAQIEGQCGKAEKPKRANKYNAQRTVYNGATYASKAEARRAAELHADDSITVARQPAFDLAGVRYVADFAITDERLVPDGSITIVTREWVEDVKGMETKDFKIKRRLWLRFGSCPLHVLKDSGDGRWITTIIPGAKKGGV